MHMKLPTENKELITNATATYMEMCQNINF